MKTYKSKLDELSLKRTKTDIPRMKINSSKGAAAYIKQFYLDDITIYESFFILLLNRANNTIGYAKISQGGTAGTVIDTKIIAKYAVDGLASSVILAHNHPSGNTKPSMQDKQVTKKIKDALKLLDVEVLDHVILTEESHYSMADEMDMN